MTDLFEAADNMQRSTESAASSAKRFAGMSLRELFILAAAVATVIWGAWITSQVAGSRQQEQGIVQLQLQGLIGEYLQAQARSSADEATAAQETAVFMATLDEAVAGLTSEGKVVVVHEAIVGGDVPDVTDQVRDAIYSKVPRPVVQQAAQATPVQSEMAAWMQANGGGKGDGAR